MTPEFRRYLLIIYVLVLMPILSGVIGSTLYDGGIATYKWLYGASPRRDISYGIAVYFLFRLTLCGVFIVTVVRCVLGSRATFFAAFAVVGILSHLCYGLLGTHPVRGAYLWACLVIAMALPSVLAHALLRTHGGLPGASAHKKPPLRMERRSAPWDIKR